MNWFDSAGTFDFDCGGERHEWPCGHCGACFYGPEPEWQSCPICEEAVCRHCETVRCEVCNDQIHRGCACQLDALNFCSEQCRIAVLGVDSLRVPRWREGSLKGSPG